MRVRSGAISDVCVCAWLCGSLLVFFLLFGVFVVVSFVFVDVSLWDCGGRL